MNDFALYPEDVVKLDKLLNKFKSLTHAEYILFCHRDGSAIAETTVLGSHFNSSTLSVLASASYGAAMQIGSMIGENDFRGVRHTGKKLAVHISPVGSDALIVQVYAATQLPIKIDEFTGILIDKFRAVLGFLQQKQKFN
jgi:predicted regulator of Ras-like GTPase activity (Roadblock/LC7/MglB family)